MAKYKLPKIKELFDAGVHFGHQTRRWHPSMEPYIYSVKKKIHIIDLEQTEALLKEACEFLYETAASGGQIVFVGTKKQARDIVQIEAKRSGAFFVSERWLGGTITNFGIIKKSVKKLVDYMRKKEEGEFDHYTKKERLLIDRNIQKLDTAVGGIVGLNSVPAAVFVVDAKREKTVVREANISGVKVVALIDTNTDPKNIDYIIPGNDDAIKSIALVIKAVADAVEAGYKEYAKKGDEAKEVKEEKSKSVSKGVLKDASKVESKKPKAKSKPKEKSKPKVKTTKKKTRKKAAKSSEKSSKSKKKG